MQLVKQKPGYKQTEIGLIPDDWACKSVGELFREGIIEKPMDGNHGAIHPKSGDFVDYGIPFVMANDVQNGKVDFERCSFIRKKQADSLLKGFAKRGDVLLTHKATMGHTAIVEEIACEYIMLTPQVTYYRVANPQRLSNRYLRHFFDGSTFQHRLEVLSGGGTRSYLGIVGQHNLLIAIPPALTEQEAIAAALSDADGLIESLEKLIAKKRQIKHGTMQELCTGKSRLLGFSTPWTEKAFGELLESYRLGGNYPNSENETSFPLMKMGNVDRGAFNTQKVEYISQNIIPAELDRLRHGDVLFNTRNTLDLVGKTAVWRGELPLAYYNSNLLRLDFSRQLVGCPFFVNAAMNSSEVLRQLREVATGTTSVAAIYTRDLLKIRLSLPSDREEQIAIGKIVEDAVLDIAALEAKLAKARQIKQGMMQELLTGRVRLV